jgi:hypothetical protein
MSVDKFILVMAQICTNNTFLSATTASARIASLVVRLAPVFRLRFTDLASLGINPPEEIQSSLYLEIPKLLHHQHYLQRQQCLQM